MLCEANRRDAAPSQVTSPRQQDGLTVLQRPTYPLAQSQVRRFRRDGHVFLPQLLPADVLAPFRDAIVATANAHVTETRALGERDTYGKAFLQIFNLWTLDETVRRFVLAPRFAAVAARPFLGVSAEDAADIRDEILDFLADAQLLHRAWKDQHLCFGGLHPHRHQTPWRLFVEQIRVER